MQNMQQMAAELGRPPLFQHLEALSPRTTHERREWEASRDVVASPRSPRQQMLQRSVFSSTTSSERPHRVVETSSQEFYDVEHQLRLTLHQPSAIITGALINQLRDLHPI